MKLAGAYAFIDEQDVISCVHVEYAIKLAQDSGEAFARLMTPQRAYIKLANYLAESKTEVTLADLDEDLPSFRGSKAQKDEQIMMATAWGYKNNIIIKKAYTDSILFLTADSIQETDLDNMIISYTDEFNGAYDYQNETVSFDKLDVLFKADGYHWINHHVKNAHRKEENAIVGFNLLVLDIDGSVNLSTAKMLLKGYKAIFYTTKRHTDQTNRFRIILPMNYTLALDAKDYKEFYTNVLNDLPFEVDEQCGHRVKKWLSHKDTTIEHTDGELFDVLAYIPKSSKNDEREQKLKDQSQLDNLERWVINNTGDGNRNNMLYRYANILYDAGFNFETIKEKTKDLNTKLVDKLDELELAETVFHSLAGKIASQSK